ncbi:methyltransferase family protein [Yoonia maritima]|uniref:Methyltransferase family protein n=1 Tax=Yoonia maritima TaxID=1435347 RepID=A0A2T0VW64_9RHOB|nr:class I SAM-dependent methyltransferase [Yoonia maritima]PRY76050.1 methyltransferase family protein [Yoonia maritima]
MPDAKTIAIYNEKAAEYAALTKTAKPDASLQAFIDLMPEGGRVLDLGCGPATASVHMRAAGLSPDPVDASPRMIEFANQNHNIGARLATFDEIIGTDEYDGVWASFSLLHAPRQKLPEHFSAIHQSLKPAGILHLGMKTGSGTARDAIERLYTYVSIDELKNMLTNAGFAIVFTREGVEKGLAGTADPFVIMRAKKETNA